MNLTPYVYVSIYVSFLVNVTISLMSFPSRSLLSYSCNTYYTTMSHLRPILHHYHIAFFNIFHSQSKLAGNCSPKTTFSRNIQRRSFEANNLKKRCQLYSTSNSEIANDLKFDSRSIMSDESIKTYIYGRALTLKRTTATDDDHKISRIEFDLKSEGGMNETNNIEELKGFESKIRSLCNDISEYYNNDAITSLPSASDQLGLVVNDTKLQTNLKTNEEMVDWVMHDGITSILSLPRSLIHKHNMFHRGIGLIIMNPSGQIFVHIRASTKRLFPSMYDMFIGGVSEAGEESLRTLHREALEEIGIDISDTDIVRRTAVEIDEETLIADSRMSIYVEEARKKPLDITKVYDIGSIAVRTSYNHCSVRCFVCLCSSKLASSVHFRDGEIESGEWVDPSVIEAICSLSTSTSSSDNAFAKSYPFRRNDFVPDGLQVWDSLPNFK